nr:hypothetical protein Iba_chr10fCG2410 [Ipomoea batatas]
MDRRGGRAGSSRGGTETFLAHVIGHWIPGNAAIVDAKCYCLRELRIEEKEVSFKVEEVGNDDRNLRNNGLIDTHICLFSNELNPNANTSPKIWLFALLLTLQ